MFSLALPVTLSWSLIWPLLIYWLVFFVACFTVVEVGQDQLYDAVTPYAGLKVAGGSLILAMLATVLKPSYDTIFTGTLHWTALQAIVWFLVFMFIFQFHPWHALAAGLVTMVMVTGLATIGVDNLLKPAATPAPIRAKGSLPIRGSLSPAAPQPSAEK